MPQLLHRGTADHALKKLIPYYIENPEERSMVITITPAIARWILDNYNFGNRPIKEPSIKRYCELMLAGKWGITGESLKFSDANLLRDGQNRLLACIRAGVSFETHVVFGIDDDLFMYLDTGTVRDNADTLSIDQPEGPVTKHKNVNILSAAVRWAHIFDTNPISRKGLQNWEVLQLANEVYTDIEDGMYAANRLYRQYGHSTGQMCALHQLFACVDATKADEFFEDWTQGKRTGPAKAAYHLQSAMVRIKEAGHGLVSDTIRAAMVIKAWNLYASNTRSTTNACIMAYKEPFPKVWGLDIVGHPLRAEE